MQLTSKILFVIVMVLAMAVASPASVYAQDPVRRPERGIRKVQIRKERLERLEERREVNQRPAERASQLERRFNAYYERLNRIIGKLDDRLNAMAAKGKDVTTAKTKLGEVRTKLAEARSLGSQAVALFRSIESGEQRDKILEARDKAQAVRKAFTNTASMIHDLVALAKKIG